MYFSFSFFMESEQVQRSKLACLKQAWIKNYFCWNL